MTGKSGDRFSEKSCASEKAGKKRACSYLSIFRHPQRPLNDRTAQAMLATRFARQRRPFMKNDKVAKPGRKQFESGRPRQKLRNEQSRKDGGLHEEKSPSPTQSRST